MLAETDRSGAEQAGDESGPASGPHHSLVDCLLEAGDRGGEQAGVPDHVGDLDLRRERGEPEEIQGRSGRIAPWRRRELRLDAPTIAGDGIDEQGQTSGTTTPRAAPDLEGFVGPGMIASPGATRSERTEEDWGSHRELHAAKGLQPAVGQALGVAEPPLSDGEPRADRARQRVLCPVLMGGRE